MTIGEERTMMAIQSINQKMPDVELRDLFAMNVINGICGSYTTGTPWDNSEYLERMARWAYSLADVMIEERKRK